MKIGVMFGNPETTTGGNALKFYASVRLDIRRIGSIKDRDEVVGNQTRVKVVKNKLAPPFKQVEFDIMYGEGISKTGELIDLGVKAGIVEKSGAWFSYDSQRLGQGRENAKQFLRDNPEIAGQIEEAIRANAGLIAEKFLEQGGPRGRRRRRHRRSLSLREAVMDQRVSLVTLGVADLDRARRFYEALGWRRGNTTRASSSSRFPAPSSPCGRAPRSPRMPASPIAVPPSAASRSPTTPATRAEVDAVLAEAERRRRHRPEAGGGGLLGRLFRLFRRSRRPSLGGRLESDWALDEDGRVSLPRLRMRHDYGHGRRRGCRTRRSRQCRLSQSPGRS